GRALARLSDLGWGDRLRAVVDSDAPVPDDIFAGVVRALTEWARGADPWPLRPYGVVAVGSRRRLVGDLARRIAQVGRLPLRGTLPPATVDGGGVDGGRADSRSEEHTSELQSLAYLV